MSESRSKQEIAYLAVRTGILNGRFQPGQRLGLEEISAELGVSPVPVREAVRRLEAEGLVKFERNVGARVVEIDPAEFGPVMRAMALLEGLATGLASPTLTPDMLAEARQVNEQLRAAVDLHDAVEVTRLNRRFHAALHQTCPSSFLLALLQQTWDRLDMIRRSVFVYIPQRAAVSADEHEELIQLIVRGAPPGDVEERAREHGLRTLDVFLERLTEISAGSVSEVAE